MVIRKFFPNTTPTLNLVPTTHSLSKLFERMDDGDKKVLSKYYTDFKSSNNNRLGLFPFENLRVFLTNLDGGKINMEIT